MNLSFTAVMISAVVMFNLYNASGRWYHIESNQKLLSNMTNTYSLACCRALGALAIRRGDRNVDVAAHGPSSEGLRRNFTPQRKALPVLPKMRRRNTPARRCHALYRYPRLTDVARHPGARRDQERGCDDC